jgi:hypothetical protein
MQAKISLPPQPAKPPRPGGRGAFPDAQLPSNPARGGETGPRAPWMSRDDVRTAHRHRCRLDPVDPPLAPGLAVGADSSVVGLLDRAFRPAAGGRPKRKAGETNVPDAPAVGICGAHSASNLTL